MTRLRDVSASSREQAKADRMAAEILAEVGTPKSYEQLIALIAIGYAKGCEHTLMWAKAKVGGEVA